MHMITAMRGRELKRYVHCASTVELPKKRHFGNGTFVLSSEVVLIWEVHEIFYFYNFYSIMG